MSSQFEQHRQALGVTPASTRILNRLEQGACTAEELERATYLGREALDDALVELVAQGNVQRLPDQRLQLTGDGHHRSAAVAERSRRFTQEKLQGMADVDLAAAQRVLQALQQR